MLMKRIAETLEELGGNETVTVEGPVGNETVTETDTDTGDVEVDMMELLSKQQCASGIKLSTSDDGSDSGDSSGAAARNMCWSFSVAAAVGFGAFLTF